MVAAAVAFAKAADRQTAAPHRRARRSTRRRCRPGCSRRRAPRSPATRAGRWRPSAPSTPSRPRRRCRSREGIARERQLFREAAASPYARALQYAFFAERQAANLPGIGADVKPRDVETVGILGAGTMGTGITLAFLNARLSPSPSSRPRRRRSTRASRASRTRSTANAKRGRITEAQAARPPRQAHAVAAAGGPRQGRSHHRGGVREHGAEEGDLRQARQIAKPGAIIATNTSTLDVDEIAAATKRPQDVLGLHFFSPANIMRLLEIVRAEKTGNDVMATAMAVAKRSARSACRPACATASSATACWRPTARRCRPCCWRAPRRRRSTARWRPGAWPWGRLP